MAAPPRAHGYQVEAYETGARAGHTIRDILAELVRVSTFALLVLTAEDEHADGTMHAREISLCLNSRAVKIPKIPPASPQAEDLMGLLACAGGISKQRNHRSPQPAPFSG